MIHVLIDLVISLGIFVGGVIVGANNSVSVEKAIATLKAEEAKALMTLQKIGGIKNTPPAAQ
jgi:hypothetical protein